MMLGKCNPLSQLREHDAKIRITHAEHYRESDNLFFKRCILTINQYKEWSFDRVCKVQLSDEIEILMDKSMLERYRKYKCCVFIDFEYSLGRVALCRFIGYSKWRKSKPNFHNEPTYLQFWS